MRSKLKKMFTALVVLLSAKAYSQQNIIFSAQKGTVSKRDTITLTAAAKSAKLASGDTASFTIIERMKNKLVVVYKPAPDFTGINRAAIQVTNAANKSIAEIHLTGLSTKGLEGENEAPLSLIADALGYQVNIGWPGLANHSRPELQGDESGASLFHKAGKGNVEIIPVARYSPDFELPFGYYVDVAAAPQLHEVGVLAKAGAFPEHQTLFPAIARGGHSFDPGDQSFGFYATGPTHNAYSEDVWNMLLHPANAVRATRIYPLKDASGKLLNHTYLLCFEEAKNGDYNDYVFLVKNVAPVTKDLFTRLFNGKNLDGWHTFMKDIGVNADPDKNFTIEDSVLHVLGKDLGYAITDKGYADYHFKVDFKWGERRWGSRQNSKRDAGVCYNIPKDEPDSIWPRAIECQIQEGDVGDFWMLGFSTIKVNGVINKPANHTRMIKQKDGEKPTGQWNTLEIISYHGKCVHIVNGIVVNVGEEATVKDGRILLQSEYAEVYYKNVMIRQL
jgi:hypothetical protein